VIKSFLIMEINKIEEKTLKKRRKHANYINIPCPLRCGKRIGGISKKHWLWNFEIHLIGRNHKILNIDERKRLIEKFGKTAIK